VRISNIILFNTTIHHSSTEKTIIKKFDTWYGKKYYMSLYMAKNIEPLVYKPSVILSRTYYRYKYRMFYTSSRTHGLSDQNKIYNIGLTVYIYPACNHEIK
jgi:hypothetical protein